MESGANFKRVMQDQFVAASGDEPIFSTMFIPE